MYKLNNQGWGLSHFLTFLVIFLMMIIVITVNSKELNGFGNITPTPSPTTVNTTVTSNESKTANTNHSDLEKELVALAKVYNENNDLNISLDESKIVTVKEIIDENYITILKDDEDNLCTGYVEVTKTSSDYIYVPYIKCKEAYETSGYSSELDQIYQ